MASLSKGTSFTDGVTGDVTAAKLHALVDAATPVGGFVTDRTAKTSVVGADLMLISDSADSNNLKKVTVTNLANNLPTAKITTGTIDTATLGTTTGTLATLTGATITNGTIETGTFGTTTSTAATITTGTITTGVIPTLTSTTLITSGTGTAAAPAFVPTGDTDTGIFFPAADTIAFAEGGAEAMRIDSSGNVGIGTTSASQRLTVFDDSVLGGILVTGSNAPAIRLNDTTDGTTYSAVFAQNDGRLALGADESNSAANSLLQFRVDATERMRIDSSGNVGIGTSTTTDGGVTITKSVTRDNSWDAKLTLQSTEANDFPALLFSGCSATNRYGAIVQTASTSGNDANQITAQIDFTNVSASQGIIRFWTNNSVGTTDPTERLRITSSGNVGIGTISPATRLHVDGTIRYTNRPAAGTITAIGFDANGDLKASSSSLRYKHNVEPYAKGLAEVAQLEPVTFNYNGEELVNAGLIVEDLDAKGFEEFVLRDSEGTADAIPYGNMVALLINAIKELKMRVEALEAA